ncbi:uncharacterized protein LOC120357847 [Solenopsis invicta]|uniref:uncharacterized protein LOC120357847 n=1 Tax=Solenopsis invicta TaxID=13686 RepID=UPI00193CD22E|nr:uncharacterized protein LOC120357847 [Solenopsis invicta]
MQKTVHVQVKDNSPSIERILSLIVYTSWLLGVGVAHPRKCPKAITIIIRIIHVTVCFFSMKYDIIFFIFHPFIYGYIPVFPYQDLHFLNRVMCCVSAYYYIYHGIRQYNKWPELMDRLQELDQKIKKEISINNWPIKIIEALAIFTTFIFCPLMPIIQALYYLRHLSRPEGLMFYYILAQSMINNFVFVVIVYVLYNRFQTVNKLIGQLDKLSDVQWIAFKIRRIRELHTDICDLATMVNNIHGLHLLFSSGNCFTMAITSLFYLFNVRDPAWLPLMHHFLCITYFMQFCLICWICTLACQESNRTGGIMHKVILNCQPVNPDNNGASNQSSLEMRFALEGLNSEQNSNCSSHNSYVVENFLRRNLDLECVTEEVNDFSTQLQQNRVAFTAYNFFEINNISFGCFVGVTVTYLIFFQQLGRQRKY